MRWTCLRLEEISSPERGERNNLESRCITHNPNCGCDCVVRHTYAECSDLLELLRSVASGMYVHACARVCVCRTPPSPTYFLAQH